MKLSNICLIIISIFIITSCKRELPREAFIYDGIKFYPIYATDYEDKDGNLDYIMSSYITDQYDTLLTANQKFYKISEASLPEVHKLTEKYLAELSDKNNDDSFAAHNFFRQYIGYTENDQKFVYVNLLNFYLEGHEDDGCPIIITVFLHTPIIKPEYGYAGYVIINLDKGQGVKYFLR